MSTDARPDLAVIIPAHNEESVIGRCLDALRAGATGGPRLEIVVAANGCTDRTVQIASTYPGVRVLDLTTPSKAAALNAGDEAVGDVFPRVYIDADIVLDEAGVRGLAETLSTAQARVAAPQVRFQTKGCSAAVRAFYRVFVDLPYARAGLVGLGVYGLSAAGRGRFQEFPDITADDLFVQRLFRPDERVITAGTFTVFAPRDLPSLLKVRTRVAVGNEELAGLAEHPDSADFAQSSGSTTAALAALVLRDPRRAPDAIVYTAIGLVARWRTRRAEARRWERDTSTR